jgi:cytochrome b561
VLALLLLAVPRRAAADLLLEERLTLDLGSVSALALAATPPDPSLDFDLLGKPKPPAEKIDDAAMKRRRTMLDLHQKVGLGLVALQAATTLVGQLNYSDKYGGSSPAVTGRYELSHSVLAYTTLGVFAVNGALALLAPGSQVKKKEWDRTTLHKIGMALAAAGMAAQGAVGIWADRREGYLDQKKLATTHLVIGYATLVAVGVGVGAIVF